MKQSITFSSFLLAASFMHAGILSDTLVQTPDGLKAIQELSIGDKVIALDQDFLQCPKSILTVEEKEIDSCVEITMDDDVVIRVSPDQRLFIPYKWIQANQLSLGDMLLKNDTTFIRIKSICVKQEYVTLRFITVEDYANFLASNNSILIHNGPISGAIGYWFTKTLCYGTAVAAAGTIVVTTGGVAGAAVGAATAAGTAAAGASTGAAIVAGAISGAGLASEAAVATAAVASTAGGLAGTVAAVETASTFVGTALTLCPFLP
ncbi:hypothetical protein KBD08_00345 [Candidatus Babeliales bacterium]|nr:hypothetical protein [Candidatus Babeliales bacterium]